jgi:hypothetical protein
MKKIGDYFHLCKKNHNLQSSLQNIKAGGTPAVPGGAPRMGRYELRRIAGGKQEISIHSLVTG